MVTAVLNTLKKKTTTYLRCMICNGGMHQCTKWKSRLQRRRLICSSKWVTGLIISWPTGAGPAKYHWWDSKYTANRSLSYTKPRDEHRVDEPTLWRVFSQRAQDVDVLGYSLFLRKSPIDFHTAVWHQWRNDPQFVFFRFIEHRRASLTGLNRRHLLRPVSRSVLQLRSG